jgi:hypothetical protein
MYQPARMRHIERIRDLLNQCNRALGRQSTRAPQQLAQIATLDVAHRDVQQPVRLAGLEDRHDPRVIERRRQPRLGQEPLAKARVVSQLRRQNLQRYAAP